MEKRVTQSKGPKNKETDDDVQSFTQTDYICPEKKKEEDSLALCRFNYLRTRGICN